MKVLRRGFICLFTLAVTASASARTLPQMRVSALIGATNENSIRQWWY